MKIEFTDWRYRLVWSLDWLLHKLTGNGERGPLCRLERTMYWRRMQIAEPDGIGIEIERRSELSPRRWIMPNGEIVGEAYCREAIELLKRDPDELLQTYPKQAHRKVLMKGLLTTDWSPAIEAAAEEIYERLRLTREGPKWKNVDIDTRDHYCIAARNAVFAFHNQAARGVEVEVTP